MGHDKNPTMSTQPHLETWFKCCWPLASVYIHEGCTRNAIMAAGGSCWFTMTLWAPGEGIPTNPPRHLEPVVKCCCPMAAVYEQEGTCGANFALACCLGWCFTMICWNPKAAQVGPATNSGSGSGAPVEGCVQAPGIQ